MKKVQKPSFIDTLKFGKNWREKNVKQFLPFDHIAGSPCNAQIKNVVLTLYE
jgi:hypothetical protein